jgi:hypothetical protein
MVPDSLKLVMSPDLPRMRIVRASAASLLQVQGSASLIHQDLVQKPWSSPRATYEPKGTEAQPSQNVTLINQLSKDMSQCIEAC